MQMQCLLQRFAHQRKRGCQGVRRRAGVCSRRVENLWAAVAEQQDTWEQEKTTLHGSLLNIRMGGTRAIIHFFGTVEDTANVALFLASELGSFVTGLYIPVCGGQVME